MTNSTERNGYGSKKENFKIDEEENNKDIESLSPPKNLDETTEFGNVHLEKNRK